MSATSSSTVQRYAAFTDRVDGGNPAGVVIADVLPSEAEMQQVAAAVGYSETAFIAPAAGDPHTRDIRYFSPQREVSFCGHATIAAGVALGDLDPDLGQVTLLTRTAEVPVTLRRDGGSTVATLTSPPASHERVEGQALDTALRAFGWDRSVLDRHLPPAIASAGATHLVLPLGDRAHLAAMEYDFDALRTLMLEQDWTTVALVWREAPDRYHARNAFAFGGVVEDPATGAAAAAFGGLLRAIGRFPMSGQLTIVQGEDMGRPSRLMVSLPLSSDRVEVSGEAVRIEEASMQGRPDEDRTTLRH